MFKSLVKNSSPYPHWEFIEHETGDRIRLVPERGGLISQWFCNGQEVLYFDKERFEDISKSIRGGIPVLFPICGNLPHDLWKINEASYTIKQHGFARDYPWDLRLLEDRKGISLTLVDNDETRLMFPFGFNLEMRVRLSLNTLNITTKVINTGNKCMPFSFGLHPYFSVEDLKKVSFNGLPNICFDHLEMAEARTEDQIKRIAEGVDFISHPSASVKLIDQINGRSIELKNEFPIDLTVVWSDPPRRMVCLEPWTSPRFSLNTGIRRLELPPGASQEFQCEFVSKRAVSLL